MSCLWPKLCHWLRKFSSLNSSLAYDSLSLTRKLSSLSSNFVFDSFSIIMKFCSLSSSFACKEVLFARFELRLSPKEVLFAKFELRLWLALINLKERLRFGFELRLWLALISKLLASSFAFSLLSSRNFQPHRTTSLRPRASLSACSHLETFSLRQRPRTRLELRLRSFLSLCFRPLTTHPSHLTPLTSHLTSPSH